MHIFDNYDAVIFDCDGVILDSNQLKVEAMQKALLSLKALTAEQVYNCVNYFQSNFGKSRYHHVEYFFKSLVNSTEQQSEELEKECLKAYSDQCLELYLHSKLCSDVEGLLKYGRCKKFVASGSDQEELRQVFSCKKLDQYFCEILGSPTTKFDNVASIVKKFDSSRVLMIGDSISDWKAASENGVEFMYYSPYSNVHERMMELSKVHGFTVCHSFTQLQSGE